jgi:predicted nuclease with TOPRIM domain
MEMFLPNEELHDELKRLRSENYHLKNQLKRKNNEIRGKVKSIRKLKGELKKHSPEKQHYKNGRRGTISAR